MRTEEQRELKLAVLSFKEEQDNLVRIALPLARKWMQAEWGYQRDDTDGLMASVEPDPWLDRGECITLFVPGTDHSDVEFIPLEELLRQDFDEWYEEAMRLQKEEERGAAKAWVEHLENQLAEARLQLEKEMNDE